MIKMSVKFPKFKKITAKEKNEIKNILLDDISQTVPVDTGKLKRALRGRLTATGIELFIQGKRNNEVAGYLIDGTDKHMVRPKRKDGTLSWVMGGKRFFSKGHMVRGIRKGYWKFQPRKRAIQKATTLLNTFIKAK